MMIIGVLRFRCFFLRNVLKQIARLHVKAATQAIKTLLPVLLDDHHIFATDGRAIPERPGQFYYDYLPIAHIPQCRHERLGVHLQRQIRSAIRSCARAVISAILAGHGHVRRGDVLDG